MTAHKTITEFIDWCNNHIKQGRTSFWDCVEKDFPDDNEYDKMIIWRDSVEYNTTHDGMWGDLRHIVNNYNKGCKLFGKDSFDTDCTQFFNDNV